MQEKEKALEILEKINPERPIKRIEILVNVLTEEGRKKTLKFLEEYPETIECVRILQPLGEEEWV